MPAIHANDLTLLRRQGHISRTYGSFLKPLTLWSMRVSGSPARGDISISFGSGSGLDFSAIEAGQTLWVGTSAGDNDQGIIRIRSIASSDSGVTGTIGIAPNSLLLANNYFLTVLHNYELWPMYPFIDSSEVFKKDGDVVFANQTRDTEPVAILDFSHRAGFIRDGEAVFWVDASRSYTTKPSTTISTYALSTYPTTGVTVTFNTSTGIGYIVVTSLTQDYYWVKLTVTDSAGKTQTTYRCIFAYDDDPTGSTYPFIDFSVNQISAEWDRGGWHSQLVLNDNATLADVPDNAFSVLWRERSFSSDEVATVKRDGNMQFVNPKIGYSTVPNGSNWDVTVNFHAGVIEDGQVAADSTSVSVDIYVNAGTPTLTTSTVTDGVVTISRTFVNEPGDTGTAYVEDTGNTQTLVSRAYRGGTTVVETPDWPSLLIAYPRSIMVGYLRSENIQQSYSPQSGRGLSTFEMTTIEDLLKNQYMFSISMASRPDGSVSTWYEYRKELTIGRALHHIWKWHSNVFDIADVIGLLDNTDGRAYAEFEGGTLFTMPDNMARNNGIRAHITCSKDGQIHLTQDAQLLNDTERAALTTVAEIDKDDRSGELGLLRNVEDRVAFVYVSGLAFNESYSPDENGDLQPDVEPYCATAPGAVPSGDGEGTINLERQVLRSQQHANEIAGRVYAQANNPFPELRVLFHGDYLDVLDIHLAEFWQMDIAATDTIRNITWTNKNLIPRQITAGISVDTGSWEINASFEPENDALPGVSAPCFGTLPVLPGIAIPPPISFGFTGSLVDETDAASIFFLATGESDWQKRKSGAALDMGPDPYWVTKQGGSDPEDAILIRCGDGFIERSTNGGTSWSDVTPSTNPPQTNLSEPFDIGPTDIEYVSYEGSTIDTNEHYFACRYKVPDVTYESWIGWILQTTDDFSTFSWVELESSDTQPSSSMTGQTALELEAASWGGFPTRSVKLLDLPDGTSYWFAHGRGQKGYSLTRSGNTFSSNGSATATPGTLGGNLHVFRTADDTAYVAGLRSSKGTVHKFTADGTGCTYVGEFQTAATLPVAPSGTPTNFKHAQLADGRIVTTYSGTFGAAERAYLYVFDPATDTFSSVMTLFSGTGENWIPYDVIGLDNRYAMVFYKVDRAAENKRVEVFIVDTDTQTKGSASIVKDDNTLETSWIGENVSTLLSDNRVCVFYQLTTFVYPIIVTWNGSDTTAPTIGTAAQGTQINTVLTNADRAIASNGTDLVLLAWSLTTATATGRTWQVGDGDTIWRTPNQTNFNTDAMENGTSTAIGLKWDTGLEFTFGYVENSSSRPHIQRLTVAAPEERVVKGQKTLSISVDKNDGDNLWHSSWFMSTPATNVGDLISYRYNINPSTRAITYSTEITQYTGAPITGVDSRQFWLGVSCDPDGAGDSYHFGRFIDDVTPVHIWHRTSAGAGTTTESGWGADYCGSLIPLSGGTLYAVRCSSTQTGLYSGTKASVSVDAADVGLNKGVDFRGMDYGSGDGVIIVASGDPDNVMVVGSVSPFSTWYDLTYNHGLNGGVVSIIILA